MSNAYREEDHPRGTGGRYRDKNKNRRPGELPDLETEDEKPQFMGREEKTLLAAQRDNDSGMQNFYRTNFEYAQLGDDGPIMAFEKPEITTTLWYNDERPDPAEPAKSNPTPEEQRQALHDYFVAENLSGFDSRYQCDRLQQWMDGDLHATAYVTTHDTDGPQIHSRIGFDRYHAYGESDPDQPSDEQREYLSDEQTEQYAALVGEWRNRYQKRLEQYWKRYGHKVHTEGYWADR